MADYILNNAWSDIDAVASAHKSGALIQKASLPSRSERDVLPVSAKPDGSLWARSAMVYSFNSMSEYDEFINEDTEKIKNGDHVWIKSTGLNNANVYTLYLYFQYGLNKAVEIVSSTSTESGEGGGAGKDAVIWYTKVGPNAKLFVISDLIGPAGATPAPGHMIVSKFTGLAYFITKTMHDAVEIGDYTVQVKGDTGPKGDKGDDGQNAVIWYTNTGPSGDIFPLQSLSGPTGASPAPGNMIVSNYTGKAYFIIEVDDIIARFGNYTVQVKPNISEIVSEVISALPVYGGETQ